MSSPLKLNFPDSTFDYWYLYWIGNPYVKRKRVYVDIYFCNCKNPNDQIRPSGSKLEEELNFTDVVYTVSVLYSSVLLYSIGSIFGRNGKVVLESRQHPRKLFNFQLKPSDRAIKIAKSSHIKVIQYSGHPLSKHFDTYDSKCFIINHTIKTKNITKTYTIILPVVVLAQSFFFYSTNLSELLINGRIHEIFDKDDLIVLKNPDNKEVELVIHYNNELVNEDEIRFLSNYIAVDINRGYRSLQYLGSNLISEFIAEKHSGEFQPKALLDVQLPFKRSVGLNGMGKYFGDTILIYEIQQWLPYHNEPAFKKIEFIKKNPGYKSDEGENKKRNTTGVKVIPTKNDGNEFSPEEDKVNDNLSDQTRQIRVRTLFDFPDLTREIIDDPDAKIKVGKGKEVIILPPGKGISAGGEQDNEFDKSYTNFLQEFDLVPRELYIELLVEELKKKNVDCQFISLVEQTKKANKFTKLYGGRLRTMMVVKMNYENRIYYLIEFPTGMTGLISKIDFTELRTFELDTFISKYLKYQRLLNSNDKSTFKQIFPNEKYYILKKNNTGSLSRVFMDDTNIAVYPFIEHQHVHMKNTEHLITHTVEKVIERIKKC